MATHFIDPKPILVINDKTGEWVMTKLITRVEECDTGSRIHMIGKECIWSPLTPKELERRLFDTGFD